MGVIGLSERLIPRLVKVKSSIDLNKFLIVDILNCSYQFLSAIECPHRQRIVEIQIIFFL
jgi:hypothetical protein